LLMVPIVKRVNAAELLAPGEKRIIDSFKKILFGLIYTSKMKKVDYFILK